MDEPNLNVHEQRLVDLDERWVNSVCGALRRLGFHAFEMVERQETIMIRAELTWDAIPGHSNKRDDDADEDHVRSIPLDKVQKYLKRFDAHATLACNPHGQNFLLVHQMTMFSRLASHMTYKNALLVSVYVLIIILAANHLHTHYGSVVMNPNENYILKALGPARDPILAASAFISETTKNLLYGIAYPPASPPPPPPASEHLFRDPELAKPYYDDSRPILADEEAYIRTHASVGEKKPASLRMNTRSTNADNSAGDTYNI